MPDVTTPPIAASRTWAKYVWFVFLVVAAFGIAAFLFGFFGKNPIAWATSQGASVRQRTMPRAA